MSEIASIWLRVLESASSRVARTFSAPAEARRGRGGEEAPSGCGVSSSGSPGRLCRSAATPRGSAPPLPPWRLTVRFCLVQQRMHLVGSPRQPVKVHFRFHQGRLEERVAVESDRDEFLRIAYHFLQLSVPLVDHAGEVRFGSPAITPKDLSPPARLGTASAGCWRRHRRVVGRRRLAPSRLCYGLFLHVRFGTVGYRRTGTSPCRQEREVSAVARAPWPMTNDASPLSNGFQTALSDSTPKFSLFY
jgi:hypothetical protein